MTILLSNDDGVSAIGLTALYQALSKHWHCLVVAPDRDCSGQSNALTLDRPLKIVEQPNGFYAVNGTPVDCVNLAMTHLLKVPPECVITGINHGANLGDDVLYSGTVGAAFEGRFAGKVTLAVSLCGGGEQAFLTAGRIVSDLLSRLPDLVPGSGAVLNVNIPECNRLKGFKVTRLGHRGWPQPPIESVDPKGRSAYWIGKVGRPDDAGEGTDFHAVANDFVSVTPLSADQTAHAGLPAVQQWLKPYECI
ncbi:5'/3'-nucleotidase SurE [Candidatus Sororendozoicomonas aggregata]|uniref:5'/3'-nucleotidase SurE n=1 Tax=Candidatus Sororendozoicomonas aggregata TaxID=3073239 RepID=UPI002ED21601